MKHAGFFVVSTVVALFAFAAPGRATHISCGATITEDTTLDSDVVCPSTFTGKAITIAANGVRLQLAGYAIRGVQSPDNASFDTAGVATQGFRDAVDIPAFTNIEILNGTIEGFLNGVQLNGAANQIRRVSITAHLAGIYTIVPPGYESTLVSGCQARVTNCIARNSVIIVPGMFVPATENYGLLLQGAGHHAWRNTVRGAAYGLYITGDNSRVALNRVEDCRVQGILVVRFATYAMVWSNTVVNCIGSNTYGIFVNAGIIPSSSGARVRNNMVTGTETGVAVYDQAAQIAENDSSGNRATGISVRGINGDPSSTASRIQQNNADSNGQYGIEAAPGAVDGGGNTASGNGVQDCVNVTCSP
jgi:Right handed beta helix region